MFKQILALVGVVPVGLWIGLSLSAVRSQPTPFLGPSAPVEYPIEPEAADDHWILIERTRSMVYSPEAQALAQRFGLVIQEVSWEDTARHKGSSVGSNISDMTIQVQQQDPFTNRSTWHLMPVIRYPNFSDQTGDIPLEKLSIWVGNETGEALRSVPLPEVLMDLRQHLSDPTSWPGPQRSLLTDRDSHVLVSAQAAFLPIPKAGIATFNPVLFNYQSYPGDPAVLTLLATREGTSVTVIDNQRDSVTSGSMWGQRLFFNTNGERASLTGERLGDVDPVAQGGDPTSAQPEDGANVVLVIQVPLQQRQSRREAGFNALPAMPSIALEDSMRASSDIEAAVIGHGDEAGPFTEIGRLPIQRDPRYPIRVTVQFYQATSNGLISATDMRRFHQQIQRVYQEADYVGSLVVEGPTERPTESQVETPQPIPWFQQR